MCRCKDKSSIRYRQHVTTCNIPAPGTAIAHPTTSFEEIEPFKKPRGEMAFKEFQRLFRRMIFTFQLVLFYALKSSQPSELIHLPFILLWKNTSIICISLSFLHDSLTRSSNSTLDKGTTSSRNRHIRPLS